MEELISFIRQNKLHSMRDIILFTIKGYTTTVEGIDIELNFYEDGKLRYIKLSTNNTEIAFKNHIDYYEFLLNNAVFESKGEHLLKKYIEQYNIKTIQEFIKAHSNSDKIYIFLTRKSVFNIKLSFGKDFSVTNVIFLDEEGNEYAKLSSEEFYEMINELEINK